MQVHPLSLSLLLVFPSEFHTCLGLNCISGSALQWPTGHHRGSRLDRALFDDHELEGIKGIQNGTEKGLEDLQI